LTPKSVFCPKFTGEGYDDERHGLPAAMEKSDERDSDGHVRSDLGALSDGWRDGRHVQHDSRDG